MAIPRLVIHLSATSTNANDVTTAGIDTTGATCLVVLVANRTAAAENTLTDSKSNTWTGLTAQSIISPQNRLRLYYAANPTVGAAHTFSLSTVTSSLPAIAILAFAGVATTSPFDQENGATATGAAASLSVGSITPTQNNALIIVGFTTTATIGPCAVDGLGVTTDDILDTANGTRITAGYGVQGIAAAINLTWAFPSCSNRIAVVASFLPTSAIPTTYGLFLD